MKRILSVMLTASLLLSITACSSTASQSSSSQGGNASAPAAAKTKITITFRDDGQAENNPLWKWMKDAYSSYDKKDSIELNVAPITASEGDYFSKIALALQSSDTAPDIVTEDTFQLNADASAGYLLPLDDYLKNYADWQNGSYVESLKKGVTASDKKTYAVPYTTDTRGLWYNKQIFKKAGLPENWAPKSYSDILNACKTIKEKVPDVIPMWFNSGKATGEATSMQTYEMLLYGTGERLIDSSSGKWITKSDNILKSLNFINTIYKEQLGPSLSKVLNGQAGNTSAREYLPQGKLAILLDGSWITGNYLSSGASPWKEYKDVLGFAAMPTSDGQAPGSITLSGGWGLAIPAKSKNHDATFDFIKHCMSKDVYLTTVINQGVLPTRTDAANDPKFSSLPFMKEATDFLKNADFRPQSDAYPSVSTQIQTMVESVVTGTDPKQAMEKYATDVTRIVGNDKVISK